MCNASNHAVGCRCGWGGDGHLGASGTKSDLANWEHKRTWNGSVALNQPNARCPICGVSVFFIRPQGGGSVWLDELGPPWPKHPCMAYEDVRESFPEPLSTPEVRKDVMAEQNWLLHRDGLKVARDDTWGCYAGYVGGTQVAMPVEPSTALTPSFVSWRNPERLYGELQYMTDLAGDPTVVTVQVCSYRLMARARASRRLSPSNLDWEILAAWIASLQFMDAEQADGLVRAIRSRIGPLSPAWTQDVALSNRVRVLTENECSAFPKLDKRMVYKWVRLFLS